MMIHVDSTFKVNRAGYPLLVIGVSDRNGSFHLVAVAVVSHRTQLVWKRFLSKILHLAEQMNLAEPSIAYAMTDEDTAQINALASVFPGVTVLRCYFHLMKNASQKFCFI